MDVFVVLAIAAVVSRGGPQPEIPPAGDPVPVEITVYEDDRAVGAERCRVELADAAPGSTCQVRPESEGELEDGWVWDFAPPWARHADPRGKP